MFVDLVKIHVKAGNGGHGAVSFRREKYVPFGGPDGGDGGDGGDIVVVANKSLRTLADYRYKRKISGKNGENGSGTCCYGSAGEDIVIEVPVGTIIKDEETGETVADMVEDNQRAILAYGGKGGRGNAKFATPVRQAPKFAENGLPGQERDLVMELRLLADVGLIGLPNAGKSTLISKISAAKPKIANYPFTTLSPVLGVVDFGESGFVVADIPGLIEGASQGLGLGHEFLRHVMRTKVLIHVVDIAEAVMCERNPYDDYKIICEELDNYDLRLSMKPQLLAANKIDMPGLEDVLESFKEKVKAEGKQVFCISALTGEGVNELLYATLDALKEVEETAQAEDAGEDEEDIKKYVGPKSEGIRDFTIYDEDGIFIVEGEALTRLFLKTDFNNEASIKRFYGILLKAGIIKALREKGMVEGDTVRIGDLEFEFVDAYSSVKN